MCVHLSCQLLSHVRLFAAPWTVAHQAPLSMEFPSKKIEVGCQLLLQGNLPDSGIKPLYSALRGDSLPLSHQGNPNSFFSLHLHFINT